MCGFSPSGDLLDLGQVMVSPCRIYLHMRSGGAVTLCTSIQTDSQTVIAQPVHVCASLHKYADHHLTSVTCAQTELALLCRNHRAQWWTSRHSVADTNQALWWQVLGTGSVRSLCDNSGCWRSFCSCGSSLHKAPSLLMGYGPSRAVQLSCSNWEFLTRLGDTANLMMACCAIVSHLYACDFKENTTFC